MQKAGSSKGRCVCESVLGGWEPISGSDRRLEEGMFIQRSHPIFHALKTLKLPYKDKTERCSPEDS